MIRLGKQASRGAAAVGALLSVACLAAPRGILGQTFQVPPRSTVAGLPAANMANPGRLITVTDGATATDCATGGGSNVVLCLDRGSSGWTSVRSSASGTVTSVSVTTANGVSATVANSTTTPALTFSLGAITPTSVAASGNVTGANLSGTNTGDQTNIAGNAATATALSADPANCATSGDFAVGIAADGSAQCATPSGGGGGTSVLGAYKTVTTTRTVNTASLDPELFVTVTAGKAYALRGELFIYPVFGGIRVTLNGTSAASLVRVRTTVATNTQINTQGRITAYGSEVAISPAGNANSEVELSGLVMVSGSGTLGVSWGLHNADGNGTQMQSGSVLTLIPLN